MASIEFVGAAVVAKTSTAAISIPLNTGLTGGVGTGVQPNDLVIIANMTSLAGTAAPTLTIRDPSAVNYTALTSTLYANDTIDAAMLVGYKFMGNTPDASATFSQSTATTAGGFAIAYVLRNVNRITPLDPAVATATGINSGLVNPPAVTPTNGGGVAVVVGCAGHNVNTNPVGSAELTWFRNANANATQDCSGGIGVLFTNGGIVTDPAAWTLTGSSTSHGWVAATIPLNVAFGNIRWWNGSSWIAKPVKYWNGTSWVRKPLKYNVGGGTFIPTGI